jgi:tetratricopeptide (TPR) repeat protein
VNRLLLGAIATLLAASLSGVQSSGLEDFEATLETVRELAGRHRYGEIVQLLDGLVAAAENSETRYILFAELGRAQFHLGDYTSADQALRQAVMIHPERIETALYLLATSYLLGDRNQAFTILREVVRSGARDLYLAVTLPGERSFLGDPEVWKILEQGSIPMHLEIDQRSIHGIRVGDTRAAVAAILQAPTRAATGSKLIARAGPYPIWSCSFSTEDRLTEVVLHTENLVKYTPYRLHIGDGDWRITPANALSAFGATADSSTDEVQNLDLIWRFPGLELVLTFGRPRPPRPPVLDDNVAMLRMVRLTAVESRDSDSMSP